MLWFGKMRELREQNEDLLKRVHQLQAELSQARESYDLLREQVTISLEAEIENHRRMTNFFAVQATGRKVFDDGGPESQQPAPVDPPRPTSEEIARQANREFFSSHRPVAMGPPLYRQAQTPEPAGTGEPETLKEETA